MPSVKITTPHVTVELDANEASIDALSKQAVTLIADTVAVLPQQTPLGFAHANTDRRGTYNAHAPINTGGAR